MARGRAWGNALGGWRKQRRAGNGRFGSGSGPKKSNATRNRRIKRAVKVGAVVGIAAAGTYAGYTAHREMGLKTKHGAAYVPIVGKYSHYTNNNAARKITGSKQFKVTRAHGGHGTDDGVWLTRDRRAGHYDGLTRSVFGKARVDVTLSRKSVLAGMTSHGGIAGGLDLKTKGVYHHNIKASALQGKRMRHNLPKTSKGVRKRYAYHTGVQNKKNQGLPPQYRSTGAGSRNQGVNATRHRIKSVQGQLVKRK